MLSVELTQVHQFSSHARWHGMRVTDEGPCGSLSAGQNDSILLRNKPIQTLVAPQRRRVPGHRRHVRLSSLAPPSRQEPASSFPQEQLLKRPAMSTGTHFAPRGSPDAPPHGTGDRFARAIIIVAGVAALSASLITFLCVPTLALPVLYI